MKVKAAWSPERANTRTSEASEDNPMPHIHSSFWCREDHRHTKFRDSGTKFVSAVVQGACKERACEPHTFAIRLWTTLSVQTTSCVFKSDLTNASLLKVKVCVAYASGSLSLPVVQECGRLWGRFRTTQKCSILLPEEKIQSMTRRKNTRRGHKLRKKKARQGKGWSLKRKRNKAKQLWAADSQKQCLSLALVCNLNVMQRKMKNWILSPQPFSHTAYCKQHSMVCHSQLPKGTGLLLHTWLGNQCQAWCKDTWMVTVRTNTSEPQEPTSGA